MTRIKIYNHNIRWSSSKKQHLDIVKKIEQLQPDIVCLQEVALEKHAILFQIKGYNVYYSTIKKPKTVLLTSLIKPLFNAYKNFENRHLHIVNRTKNPHFAQRIKSLSKALMLSKYKNQKNNQFLCGYLMVLVRDKPNKVIYKAFMEQGEIFGNMAERVAGKGYLKIEFDDFIIFNTHLLSSHKKKKVEIDKKNENQLIELLNKANSKKNTLLIGDFNFGPESSKYELTSKWNDVTSEIPITEYYWKTRLDYIFTNFEPEYSSCSIVQFDSEPSDHYGIWCEIEFETIPNNKGLPTIKIKH